jgi:4-alpha-glucanotransferase
MTNMNELLKRRAGVLLHITSLPGPYGIGDFGPAAFQFVDWLKATGQSIWQLLPTTPVGPGNSPYQSVSAFAGSPLMVAFEPMIERGWIAAPSLPSDAFDAKRADFGRVIPWRLAQLRHAFAGFQAKASAADKQALADWSKAQAYWVDDYALFMALETAHGGKCWWDWDALLMRREAVALAKARTTHASEIAFWLWVQWCFDVQCSAIKKYANDRGIIIMGDLPIFIAHHSADCWARPDLYFLDAKMQPTVIAGVPPDDLGPEGQRWGNPLYRWDKMAAEDYAWWSARVRRALDQADVFRIDHFRGFAGYWEIPSSSPTAKEGRWVTGPGKALFDAIKRALGEVPIVAEDLGLITPDVVELRDSCGFPGMRILQFGFGADGNHEFLPQSYIPATVAYSGTHDNDTARGWWDNTNERERSFAGTYLACGAHDVHWGMIRAICNSVAAMAIYPLQDVLGLGAEHRMNIPGTLGGRNWEWRFTWDMLGHEPSRVLRMIAATSGRAPIALLSENR